LFPKISVLRVQDRNDLPIPSDNEIWLLDRCPALKRILGWIISKQALEPALIFDVIAIQVFPQEPGQESLEETIHIEQEAWETNIVRSSIERGTFPMQQ
jgi:hypothetical protein